MKRSFLTVTLGLVAASVLATAAQAQTTQYVRYEQGGEAFWGILEGSVEDGTIQQLSDAPYLGGTTTGVTTDRGDVRLLAPADPRQIYMTAFNFLSHITGEPAEYPGIFLVPSSSIAGPEDDIVIPEGSSNLHYEAEMAVVVGCEAVELTLAEAEDCIFGITAGNDISERGWQFADLQWTRAKGSRGFNLVGPVLVSGLDSRNLQITGRLNGEVVQGENTSDLLYDIPYMIQYISEFMALSPGDMVWTGTMGSTRSLSPGDVYEVEVEGVGILRNEVSEEM